MTEQASTKKLAAALRAVGLEVLAVKAEMNEYHDFLSPHDLPVHALLRDVDAAKLEGVITLGQRDALKFRIRNGDFDATTEEAEEWGRSQNLFDEDTGQKIR